VEGIPLPSKIVFLFEENWCPFLFYLFEGIQENLPGIPSLPFFLKKKKSDGTG